MVQLLAIKRDGKVLAVGLQAERVPLVLGNFGVRACDLNTTAAGHAIEPDIVFERVGAHHIVVIGIGEAQRDSAGLIDASRYRFEPQRNIEILG